MPDLVERPRAGRVFEGARRVRLADVSPAGRLRLDAAARFLQDVSADDTADAALPDAEAWVVRKTVIEVATFPRYLEPIALATWCSGTGSHWAERRISIVGEGGGAIEAATTWVHFDVASGRPSRIPAGFDELYGEAGRRPPGEGPPRPPRPTRGRPRRVPVAAALHRLRRPRPRQQRRVLAARRGGASRRAGTSARRSGRGPAPHRHRARRDGRGDPADVDERLSMWAWADGVVAVSAQVRSG